MWRSFRRRREAWWCRTVCSRWAEMVVGGSVGLRVTGVILWAPPVQDSVLSAHHPRDYPGPEVESPRHLVQCLDWVLFVSFLHIYLFENNNISHCILYCHSPESCKCESDHLMNGASLRWGANALFSKEWMEMFSTTCIFWDLDRKNQFVSPGFPSPVKSRVSPPSVQSPVFLLAPSWVLGKPRARLSLVCIYQKHVHIPSEWVLFPSTVPSCVLQVLSPEQQRAFCRIGALIRGFLTRRLLRTEKVKHLCQTVMVRYLCNYAFWNCQIKDPPNLYKELYTGVCVQDTQEFIRSFQAEAQNRDAYSAQDHSLQERVRAQVRTSPTECRALSLFRSIHAFVFYATAAGSSLWHLWHLFRDASGGSIDTAAAGQGAPGGAEAARNGIRLSVNRDPVKGQWRDTFCSWI